MNSGLLNVVEHAYHFTYYVVIVQMSSYVIVEFVGDDSVECLPRSWIHDNNRSACWPSMVSQMKITNAIKRKTDPNANTWESCPVRIMATAGKNLCLCTA